MDGTRTTLGLSAASRRARLSRRAVLRGTVAAGAPLLLPGRLGGIAGPRAAAQDAAGANPRHFAKAIEPAANAGGIMIQGGPLDGVTISSLHPVIDIYQPAVGLIFERLVELDVDTYEPVGNLAESWVVADDGLTWTVTLRPNVRWHDGQTLTADDVKFAWDSHANEATGAPEVSYIAEVLDRVEVVDPATVAFRLKAPVADFAADYLQWYPIIPKHVWETVPPEEWLAHPGSDGSDPAFVVGTGPFRFREWVQGDHITLDRFDDYWDGRPHLDQFILKIVEDSSAIVGLLQTGEVDFADSVDPALLPSLDPAAFAISSQWHGAMATVILNLDPARTPLFTDARVRQAMAWALDREATIEAADFGYGAVPIAFMLPDFWALDEAGITNRYGYDPERAAALLEEAGWTPGPDGVRQKDGRPFAFTLLLRNGDARETTRMQIVQENWRNVGIAAELQFGEYDALYERWFATDYDALAWELYLGPTPEHSFLWSTGNHPGFSDPRIDELYDLGRAETEREERVGLYTEVQNRLMEQLPAIPIANRQLVNVASVRVHNVFEDTEAGAAFNAETWWIDA